MARRRGPRIELDNRTETMTAEALQCRSWNHPWLPVPQGAARRRELLTLGQTEGVRRCSRCGARKVEVIDRETWDVVSSRTEYPDGYLVAKHGTGRLPRREARKAMFVRSAGTLV